MKLTVNTYFDDFSGEFITEKFYIDGNEVSENDYDDMLDEFDEANCVDEGVEFDPCDGCQCRCCEAERFTYDDLLNIFVERIIETGPCEFCLKELLDEFAGIFIGDEDEEEYIN